MPDHPDKKFGPIDFFKCDSAQGQIIFWSWLNCHAIYMYVCCIALGVSWSEYFMHSMYMYGTCLTIRYTNHQYNQMKLLNHQIDVHSRQ